MKAGAVRFILAINLFFSLSLALSCLAPFVNPEKFWLIAFFGLGFPILLIANICWLVFWLLVKRGFALLSSAAILAGAWNISNHFDFSGCVSEKAQGSFSTMTFNVKVFDLYNWNHNVASKDSLLKLIETANPDVLCRLEFYTDDTEDFNILQRLKAQFPYYHFQKTLTLHTYHHWGIATFSKFPITGKEAILFNNSKHNLGIATDVVIGEKDTFRIFNAHLQSVQFGKAEYEGMKNLEEGETDIPVWKIFRKLKQAFIKRAYQTNLFAARIAKSPYKVVVCADFNDPPSSYTYRMISSNLSDSFKDAGCGVGRTYSGPFPAYRIDYILADKKIKTLSHQIIRNTVSDHYAVKASFKLQ